MLVRLKRHIRKVMVTLFCIIIFFLFCCTNSPQQTDSVALIPIDSITKQVKDDIIPVINQDEPLKYNEFVWLLVKKLNTELYFTNPLEQALLKAKELGYIPTGMDTDENAVILREDVATLLVNTKNNINIDYKTSDYDWQIFDLQKADEDNQYNLLTCYVNGLMKTSDGLIEPKRNLYLEDANIILNSLIYSIQRNAPICMQAPYFEYEGLVEIQKLDPSIILDLKYATKDNITGKVLYKQPLCLLQADVANQLVKANKYFKDKSYTIKIWDGYRTVEAAWELYNATPDDLKQYAPPPGDYSQHIKGIAIDVTLVDYMKNEIDMPTKFDDFSIKAHSDYNMLSEQVISNRELLINGMERFDFKVFSLEWWHYCLTSKESLKISKVTFEDFIENRNNYYLQILKK